MSIVDSFTNQEIFITGGSGFMGKSLIEKILRDLPNVGKLYVMFRSKKGRNAEERLQDMLATITFRRALEEQPEAFKKVIAIAGDCKDTGLGISTSDLEKIQNVTTIFHVAASVRFDEDLKIAILQNTRGTYELIKIAEKLPNLKAFIHISTSFAHPYIDIVEEKIYPSIADWRTTIKLAETYDTETLNILFPKYSDHQPNTYTFTKSLAEHVINDYRDKLPVVICRPSVVISAVIEPFPGWTDNYNNIMGILLACGAGIMRTNCSNPDIATDLMPVDICTMGFLVAAFKTATRPPCKNHGELDVFNFSNSNTQYLSAGEIIEMGKIANAKNPLEKMLWFPGGSITRCAVWHNIRLFAIQLIPFTILDGILRLANQTPFLIKLQRRIYSNIQVLHLFMNKEWTFKHEQAKALENLIPDEEKCLFSVLRFEDYDPMVYFSNGIIGAKICLLNQSPQASSGAHFRYKMFKISHNAVKVIGYYYVFRYLYSYLSSYVGFI